METESFDIYYSQALKLLLEIDSNLEGRKTEQTEAISS